MKPDPNIFLEAAQLMRTDGNLSECETKYACNALRNADEHGFAHVEQTYFSDHFLDGKVDITGAKFGSWYIEENCQHRILALLFCWAMLSNP